MCYCYKYSIASALAQCFCHHFEDSVTQNDHIVSLVTMERLHSAAPAAQGLKSISYEELADSRSLLKMY